MLGRTVPHWPVGFERFCFFILKSASQISEFVNHTTKFTIEFTSKNANRVYRFDHLHVFSIRIAHCASAGSSLFLQRRFMNFKERDSAAGFLTLKNTKSTHFNVFFNFKWFDWQFDLVNQIYPSRSSATISPVLTNLVSKIQPHNKLPLNKLPSPDFIDNNRLS